MVAAREPSRVCPMQSLTWVSMGPQACRNGSGAGIRSAAVNGLRRRSCSLVWKMAMRCPSRSGAPPAQRLGWRGDSTDRCGAFTPHATWPVSAHTRKTHPAAALTPGFNVTSRSITTPQMAIHSRSSSRSHLTPLQGALSAPFTTTVFRQHSRRWFEASRRMATPKGHEPSSPAQHRVQQQPLPVTTSRVHTHHRPVIFDEEMSDLLDPSRSRRGRCPPATRPPRKFAHVVDLERNPLRRRAFAFSE